MGQSNRETATGRRGLRRLLIGLALAAGVVFYAMHMRAALLGMDIAKMNGSGFWRGASAVLLTPQERGDIKQFTSDKQHDWEKFFTLASGMTVRQVIDSHRQTAR
ncbi:hypothetical protein CEK28_03510 [Xenophilus sp. AP218F]|nr:hypothetical protein [Chromobacterium sp. ASV5]OWY40606.1 hypothetical protein CEK28_03510 [Xenophilus sp. AP218F]